MNRRDLIKSTLMAAGALSSRGALSQEVLTSPQKGAHSFPSPPVRTNGERMPNILWIIADEQRADTIEGLNNPFVKTPNLKKFMEESVTFTNAFVQCPICSPSRASMLTGRYPHTTGLRSNGQKIRPTEQLITRLLADFDYTCGLSGKLHLSPCFGGQVEDRIDDGYKVFNWSHDLSDVWPGHNMWRVWLERQGIKFPRPPAPPAENEPWGVPLDPKYMQTAWCSDRAIDFMRAQKTFEPWLMSVNIFHPHHPLWPTEEYLSHYDADKMPVPPYQEGELDNKPIYQRVDHMAPDGGGDPRFKDTGEPFRKRCNAAYYAMIEEVDHEVGRMLQVLEDTGQADNTIVIYQSDHGDMMGDHGIYFKGPYFYDGLTRVPLMIRYPKHYKAGLKTDALVEILDIAPTLCEAAGIPVPSGMQGRSLTPLLTGQTTTHRDSVFVEYFDAWSLYNPPPMAASVRTTTHKVSYYQGLEQGELYDLVNDPGEVHNLWGSSKHKDVQAEMMVKLSSRLIATTDPLPERLSIW